MKNKKNNHKKYKANMNASELNDFIWGSNAEAKQDALSVYLIHAIAEKYHGNATVNFDTKAIDINVPDSEKTACLAEIEEKTGMAFQ
jgi:hypothetical protein